MAESSANARKALPPGVAGLFPLLGRAFGRIRRNLLLAAILCLALAAVKALGGGLKRLLDIPGNLADITPAYLAFVVIMAAAASAVAAVMLRLFLGRGPEWRRAGRGFIVAVGLLTLASLTFSALTVLTMGRARLGPPGQVLFREGLLLIESMVAGWICVRLLLWPIGALAGDASMTPGRSWRLMRGYVAPYVGVVVLFSLPTAILPPLAVALRLTGVAAVIDHTAAVLAVVGPIAALFQHAAAASLYRDRTAAEAAV